MKFNFPVAILAILIYSQTLNAQSGPGDNLQGRLYRLVKVWGYVKYHHTAVTNCSINWDSAMVKTAPLVENAADSNQFNAAILQMLQYAGPMTLASGPPPDMSQEIAINTDVSWLDDPYFSDSVRTILDTIRNNFRPGNLCNVQNDTSTSNYTGWLVFPGDSISLDILNTEPLRILAVARFWNILKYFNPNSQRTDIPWDSVLLQQVLDMDGEIYPIIYYKMLLKMCSALDDAHTEGLSESYNYYCTFPGCYSPKIALVYTDSSYVVSKSEITSLHPGDIIDSVNGLSTMQMEDSLRPYISAGNPAVFRRFMCQGSLLFGAYNASYHLAYTDSTGAMNHINVNGNFSLDSAYYLRLSGADTTHWKTLGCDIGYVNIGYLRVADIPVMYSELSSLPAIIFDLRIYPADNTAWTLADYMYPGNLNFSKLSGPDVTYPGYFTWFYDYLGTSGNSTPYTGKVILLMNENTQSAGEYSCMIMEKNIDVIKIGSQTAGADGNVTWFSPTQDLQSGFSTLGVYYPDGTPAQRTGIVPDVVVKPTIAGIRHGIDEVLDSAISIACAVPNAIRTISNDRFALYPNPGTNYIILSDANHDPSLRCSITDIFGRELQQVNVPASGQGMDISNLASGIYFVNIYDAKQVLIQSLKFVKVEP